MPEYTVLIERRPPITRKVFLDPLLILDPLLQLEDIVIVARRLHSG